MHGLNFRDGIRIYIIHIQENEQMRIPMLYALYKNGALIGFDDGSCRVDVFRIMWNGKRGRVIFSVIERIDNRYELPISDGDTVELRCAAAPPVDIPEFTRTIYRLENCQLKRQWIPKLEMATRSILKKYIEYECDIVHLI
jgi:hypothetical protein